MPTPIVARPDKANVFSVVATRRRTMGTLTSNPHADVDGKSIDKGADEYEKHAGGDASAAAVLCRDPVSQEGRWH